MSLEFRKARVEDALGIARVRVKAWQEGFEGILPQAYLDAMSIEEAAKKTKGWMSLPEPPGDDWVVGEGEQIVGWAHIFVPARGYADDASVAEVSAIYVSPSYWGAGVGHLMMNELIERFAAEAVQTVTLWVMEDNTRARGFYERHGFVLAEGRRELGLVKESGVWEVSYARRVLL